jgi:hypothetical protein
MFALADAAPTKRGITRAPAIPAKRSLRVATCLLPFLICVHLWFTDPFRYYCHFDFPQAIL